MVNALTTIREVPKNNRIYSAMHRLLFISLCNKEYYQIGSFRWGKDKHIADLRLVGSETLSIIAF